MASVCHGISKYLTSNEPPTFYDSQAIRSLIDDKSLGIAHLQHEIWTLEDQLAELRIQKTHAEQDLELHRSLLCGLRRLPFEILGEIFMIRTREDRAVLSPPERLKAPMLFCQVSKAWRQAAISNPLLWSMFGMDVSSRPHELTDLWLQRSQKTPLTLGLYVNGNNKQELHDIRTRTITLVKTYLIPHLPRCRSFTLRCAGEFDDQLLEELPLPNRTILEELDLPLDLPNCPFMFQWCFRLSITSPKLRRLVCGIPSVLSIPTIWSYIERVDLRFMGLKRGEVEHFLKISPRLKEFHFGLISRDSTSDSPAEVTEVREHHSLKAIKIFDRSDHLGSLLDTLKLPKLVSLAIMGRRHPWGHSQMMGFLERSGCALKQLNIENTNVSAEDMIAYLSMKNVRENLEDLRVNKTVPVSTDLLKFLIVPSPEVKVPIQLPKLRSFMCSIDPVNQASLYENSRAVVGRKIPIWRW